MSRLPDLDEFLNDDYDTKSWLLGYDTDCETCGISWNEAEFDPHFSGEHEWSFHYRVGCYGGVSLYWGEEDRERKLEEMFLHLRIFPGWNKDAEDYVRNMIKESDDARSKNTNS